LRIDQAARWLGALLGGAIALTNGAASGRALRRALRLRLWLLWLAALGAAEELFDFAAKRFFERRLIAGRGIAGGYVASAAGARVLRRDCRFGSRGRRFSFLLLDVADQVGDAVEHDEDDRREVLENVAEIGQRDVGDRWH
jgi:hypothetical protein